jgi:GTP cyclohydrolase II
LIRTEPISLLTPHGLITATLITDEGRMCVVIEEPTDTTEVLVRVQSSCMFSESLGAIDCDCNSQLKESIRRVKEQGGVVVYLFEEGRGIGLRAKFEAVHLQQETGLNTAQAFKEIGRESDPRDYGFVAKVLTEILGPSRSAVLMTNNPTRTAGLIEQGVRIARTESLIIRTPTTEGYLAGKAEALGHQV